MSDSSSSPAAEPAAAPPSTPAPVAAPSPAGPPPPGVLHRILAMTESPLLVLLAAAYLLGMPLLVIVAGAPTVVSEAKVSLLERRCSSLEKQVGDLTEALQQSAADYVAIERTVQKDTVNVSALNDAVAQVKRATGPGRAATP